MNKKFIVTASMFLFLALALIGNYSIQQMHSGGFYRTNQKTEPLGNVVYYQEGLYATVSVRDVTTIEIEPQVAKASEHFRLFNLDVLENPNHTLIIDDGRNYLLKNKEKYDLIISEPTSTWQSFSTQLYSQEFLEIVESRLSDDGVFVNWVPIYSMSADDFKSFYRTFNSIFTYNVAFANIKPDEPGIPASFETSQLILIGSKNEVELDKENLIQNYNSLPETSKQFLELIHLNSGEDIYNLFLFDDRNLVGYADDSELITDDNLILEFSRSEEVLNQNSKKVINDIEKFISE